VTEKKSGSVARVRDALAAAGHPANITEFDETTRSGVEAAGAIGCSVSQIAKSLIFRAGESGRPVLVIACGDNRVNEAAVAEALGEPIARADPKWVRTETGFAIGGVAPVGHLTGESGAVAIFIDADLQRYDRIWAAAGSPRAVFETDPESLIRMTGGAVLRVA